MSLPLYELAFNVTEHSCVSEGSNSIEKDPSGLLLKKRIGSLKRANSFQLECPGFGRANSFQLE